MASRRAGLACGCWLLVLGILGKVGGFIVSIPDPVLGGMTVRGFPSLLVPAQQPSRMHSTITHADAIDGARLPHPIMARV